VTDDYEPRQVREEAAVSNSICITKQSDLTTFSYRKIVPFSVQSRMHGQGSQFPKFPSSTCGAMPCLSQTSILQSIHPVEWYQKASQGKSSNVESDTIVVPYRYG